MALQNGIRQAYYTVYSAALSGQKLKEDDFPFMASPPHMRHCVDLLRQSLMCKPDTTIEVVNETLNGVTGFGTEHQCRDFGQLLDWTSQWEGYDNDQKAEMNELEVSAEHQHHDRHISQG
ncbi:MAG: hypothetical protein Q9214_001937 [Letrouitia sp. 1 TL-2023]